MIPPEPGPDPPDPPEPEPPVDSYWAYDSLTTGPLNAPLYTGVDSANDSFVGVVTVGLTGGANWYSDGSLLYMDDKYYPYMADQWGRYYFDYETLKLYEFDDERDKWVVIYHNCTVFDQVPSNFLSYLASGEFTLVPDHS